ncbi:RtcB family protein [Xanthomonas phage JGB6]|nr:RtcB family protein [Xanthomonas phage JGB6]
MWTPVHEVESQALDQLKNIANLPWVFHHVAAMPDVHYGKGATVGSVIAMKDAVSPAAVGVDIGCGMGAVLTNLRAEDLPDSLRDIRLQIERDVPVGFNAHGSSVSSKMGDSVMGRFKDLRAPIIHTGDFERRARAKSVRSVVVITSSSFAEIPKVVCGCCCTLDHATLARLWLNITSPSLGAWPTILPCPTRTWLFFSLARRKCRITWHDLMWAQEYAFANRATMKELIMRALKRHLPTLEEVDYIACHHNYVSEETHYGEEVIVTRKGAIYAGRDVYGIIPGSMGTKSYIVRGRGNPESFQSASHGAGRRMSRGAAKRVFNLDDLAEQTSGVECRKDAGVLDEAPKPTKTLSR